MYSRIQLNLVWYLHSNQSTLLIKTSIIFILLLFFLMFTERSISTMASPFHDLQKPKGIIAI